MDLSIFFAQFWGVYMLFFGVVMLVRPQLIDDIMDTLENNRGMMTFIGSFIFMLGIVLVLLHNVWEASWRVLITLFAWATLIKGAKYILVPDWLLKQARFMVSSDMLRYVATAFVIVIGLYLSYIGFGLGVY